MEPHVASAIVGSLLAFIVAIAFIGFGPKTGRRANTMKILLIQWAAMSYHYLKSYYERRKVY